MAEKGYLIKSAEIIAQDIGEDDLDKINAFALSPLTADEIFVFKTILGDNETDDRNFEPFNAAALADLKELYVGKTVIKDHDRTADNQVARVYDTELQTDPTKTTGAGEPFANVVAKCYMVKTAGNADLIAEIKAGIKKEVSTAARPKKLVCNICGCDGMTSYCGHFAGRKYDGVKCLKTIDGVSDAYELSFVAVPAQPRAGTTKEAAEDEPPAEENKLEKTVFDAKSRWVESYIFIHKKGDFEA